MGTLILVPTHHSSGWAALPPIGFPCHARGAWPHRSPNRPVTVAQEHSGHRPDSPGSANSCYPSERTEGVRHTPMMMTRLCGLATLIVCALGPGAAAQPASAQPADLLLNTARKAYADANYPFAIEKFREVLTNFA